MISESAATSVARLGFAARGLVYILVGWFAIDAARSGGAPSDNQAAMASLVDEPFGRILLAIIAIGLAGYAFWRLTEAAFDPERIGTTAKGSFRRAGNALSGITHVGLAFYAARLAMRERVSSQSAPGDRSAEDWSAWLMEQPGGLWMVGLVGLALFAVAAAQAIKAYKGEFTHHLRGGVPAPDYVRTLGRLGYAARAIVFTLTGWFFIAAARTANPDEAGGLGQALRSLQAQEFGGLLLGVVAAGLLLFGVYSLVEARYRSIAVKVD